MRSRSLIRSRKFQKMLVVPRTAKQRNSHWEATAKKSSRNRDLRQAGERAFFARTRFRTVTDEPAFVCVRPGDISRVEQGVGMLSVHQIDKQFSKSFAPGE